MTHDETRDSAATSRISTELHDHIAALAGGGPISIESVKDRPWGAVFRVHAGDRLLYLKTVGPGARHEPRLLADIAARQPGLTPTVVAVDDAAGWILMADHGGPMRDTASPAEQVSLVEGLLPVYAELQRTSADLVDRWLDAGVPDRSPPVLPDLVDDLLAGRGSSGPLPVDDAELAAFRAGVSELEPVGDELTGLAIDHADIHGTNVLVGGDGPRLADWGDACISHPFASLLVPIEWVVNLLPASDHAAAVARLRRAYLEPWGAAGDGRLLARAVWIGYVARAISNDQQGAGGTAADIVDAQREIVELLRIWHAKRALLNDPERMLLPHRSAG